MMILKLYSFRSEFIIVKSALALMISVNVLALINLSSLSIAFSYSCD